MNIFYGVLFILFFALIFIFLIKNKLIIAKENKDYHLTGQLKKGTDSILLHTSPGFYLYTFHIKKGRARLGHHQLNPDGATWMIPASHNSYYDFIGPCVLEIKIKIGTSFNEVDQLLIVNTSLTNELIFSYDRKEITS
ncbi:hypothetical protein WQ54_13325 [Bacillus sp. SA1-12]|uniref:hypothetical protein n=1 Tax=Bacillus sp. SA1-12 TaxID=1455638 RepID=UPI000625DEB6|nr:hypothetical protein [Bacillus sp. SA1-12]KKI91696.1 hypothetical protein WQ54_13325 [Bacillus sp. SA1-12]